MKETTKKFYVIRCNKKENRYLSFVCSANKDKTKFPLVLECGQSNPNQLSTSIFFDTEEEATEAIGLYIRSGRIKDQYVDLVIPLEVTIDDNNIYMMHSFKVNENGKTFNGYISITEFDKFIRS